MADKVNPQITDSVTQTNSPLADAPAIALATLYQAAAQSMGIAMQNAVTAQQQLNVLGQAVTSQGVENLMRNTEDLVSIDDLLDSPFLDLDDEENN